MANPQKENGHTQIANEILEHLIHPGINGSEYRIAICVLRKTYGFNKIHDRISLSQFQKATLMKRKDVVKTIKSLVGKRVLVKEENVYKFNKDWEEWVVGKRVLGGQKGTRGSTQMPTKSSGQMPTHKRKKENYTKDITELRSVEIAKVIDLFKEVNPSYKKLFGSPPQRKAALRLLEINGMEKIQKIVSLLPKSNAMEFMPVITTPCQLEDKMGQLASGWQRVKNKQPIIL